MVEAGDGNSQIPVHLPPAPEREENVSLAALGSEIRNAVHTRELLDITNSNYISGESISPFSTCNFQVPHVSIANTCSYFVSSMHSVSDSSTCTRVDQGFHGADATLSRQGQTVMQTLNPYLTNFTLELQKFLATQENQRNPIESKLIEEIEGIKPHLNQLHMEVSHNKLLLEEILERISYSNIGNPAICENPVEAGHISNLNAHENHEILDVDSLLTTPPAQSNCAIKITKKLAYSTPARAQTCISNRLLQVKVQDINPFCHVLNNTSIAGIIPPKALEELSYEQKIAVKRQSKSDINFAVNLVRIAIPANRRFKMSCTGKSKSDFGHTKETIPGDLITRVIECAREMWGTDHSPKEFTEAIDSDCRQLFSKAKECRVKRSCAVCHLDRSISLSIDDSLESPRT